MIFFMNDLLSRWMQPLLQFYAENVISVEDVIINYYVNEPKEFISVHDDVFDDWYTSLGRTTVTGERNVFECANCSDQFCDEDKIKCLEHIFTEHWLKDKFNM